MYLLRADVSLESHKYIKAVYCERIYWQSTKHDKYATDKKAQYFDDYLFIKQET